MRPSRRVAGWFAVGASASLIELVLLRLLYEGFAMPLPIATGVAAETLILAKFFVSDRWVFGHRRPTVMRLLRYHGASAGALVVYWLVINGLSDVVGLPYVAGFILGTAAAFVWSLLSNFLWVWKSLL